MEASASTNVQCRMSFDMTFRVNGTLTRVRVNTYALVPNESYNALVKVVEKALECKDDE